MGRLPEARTFRRHSSQRVENRGDDADRLAGGGADHDSELKQVHTNSIFHDQEVDHVVTMFLRPAFAGPTVRARPVKVTAPLKLTTQLVNGTNYLEMYTIVPRPKCV